MQQHRQLRHILSFVLLVTIMLFFQGCIYEPHCVTIIENNTDSTIYITTPIDIVNSKIVYRPYEPNQSDITKLDTNDLRVTFKVASKSNVTILEQHSSSPVFNINYLSIKSPKQNIVFTSSSDITNAFTKIKNDTCKLTIDK
jgi:hypothetical protein